MTHVPGFLTHLPRDDRGRPVPYINAWGDTEDTSRYYLADDPYTGHRSVFFSDDKPAGPNFLKQSPQRQREVTRLGRCQVCRRGVLWPDRCLLLGPTFALEKVDLPQVGECVATHEPWLCPECAEYAVRVCPGLIRRRRDENLRLVTGLSERSTVLALSYGTVDGPLEAETKASPIGMWLKIALPVGLLERVVPEIFGDAR